MIDVPLGFPVQSEHVELSPLQTPHSSLTALPPQTPKQSAGSDSGQSTQLDTSLIPPLHTPQTSSF